LKLLLDTHALLWWSEDDPRLGKKARRAIMEHGGYVSLGTAWELSIKVSLGKLGLAKPVDRYFTDQLRESSLTPLPIELRHIAFVETMPHHHGDPFDRLLVAQATLLGLTVLSADKIFSKYKVRRLWG
jgi:PIN domain nuclease of toxin-antitoxin system